MKELSSRSNYTLLQLIQGLKSSCSVVYLNCMTIFSLLVMLGLLVIPMSSIANDAPFCWKAYPNTSGSQCHDEKSDAINDFESKGLPYSLMSEQFSIDIADESIRYNFKMPDEDVYVGPWVYTPQHINVNPLPTFDTEEAAFNALSDFLMEQRLSATQQHPCYPYSVLVPGLEWISTRSRYGISYTEYKVNDHTFYNGDYYGTIPPYWYVPCEEHGPGSAFINRHRTVQCPLGSLQIYDSELQVCVNRNRARVTQNAKYKLGVPPNVCPPKVANPCSPASGEKSQTETDYSLANGTLKIQRTYNSQPIEDGYTSMGPRWRHNYSQRFNGYEQPMDDQGVQVHPYPVQTLTSHYDSPRNACYQGWNELKTNIYGGLLANSMAYYMSGLCQIRHGSEYVLKLPIINTLNHKFDAGTYYGINYVSRGNGTVSTFLYKSGQWQSLYPGKSSLTSNDTGWTFKASDGSTEEYDSDGKLISKTSSTHQTTLYHYGDEGRLESVTGHYGDTLTYVYDDAGILTTITTPDGDLEYGYDAEGRLASVTYPDNKTRQYHYEDPDFPYHLTGITDENNDRYATWAYDDQGKAILSEHANGAERFEFTYNADGTTTLTDAAGTERIYHFLVKQGQMKVDYIEGDRCTACANSEIQAYTYDNNGFVTSKTDWNGSITTYSRDAQGRELSRTEASGTPHARVFTTSWDTTINKPMTVTEPDKITEFTYNAAGQLVSRQQRAVQ